MQQEYVQAIWPEFGDNARAIVLPFETEIRGMPMRQCLCDAVLVADAKSTSVVEVGQPQEVAP